MTKTFILGDEVEGMMAEDKNVLINTKQNKKTYELPIELWNIVKSYSLQPPSVHQAIEKICEIDMMRTWEYDCNIYQYSYSWYNLKKYLNSVERKKIERKEIEFTVGYKGDIIKVLKSKAIKAKAEALEFLTKSVKATQKKYKERKHYYYFSNDENAVLTRKLYAGDLADEMPRMDKWHKESYKEYKRTLTLLNL